MTTIANSSVVIVITLEFFIFRVFIHTFLNSWKMKKLWKMKNSWKMKSNSFRITFKSFTYGSNSNHFQIKFESFLIKSFDIKSFQIKSFRIIFKSNQFESFSFSFSFYNRGQGSQFIESCGEYSQILKKQYKRKFWLLHWKCICIFSHK